MATRRSTSHSSLLSAGRPPPRGGDDARAGRARCRDVLDRRDARGDDGGDARRLDADDRVRAAGDGARELRHRLQATLEREDDAEVRLEVITLSSEDPSYAGDAGFARSRT